MRNCGCGCNTFQSGEICRFHHDFFCFSPQPAATKTHQFRLNRLRSAIQYVGQAHTSLNTERSAGTAFKTKSGAQGGGLSFSLGTRAGILGKQPELPVCGAGSRAPFLSACLHPHPAPPLPLLPPASLSIVPLSSAASVQPGPAHGPAARNFL